MNYLAFHFVVEPIEPYRDMLLYYLNEIGFESHNETEKGLESFIPEDQFDQDSFDAAISIEGASISYDKSIIEQQNWNALWESNFEPVWINDQCVICADFHDVGDVEYKILINPKMSFGTGHHATTSMICEQLFDEKLDGLEVLDMGCGTAILAILSIKLGAEFCDAIDIDDWAVSNSIENIELNNCNEIFVEKGDASVLGNKSYSLILANINKNVLLDEMETYVSVLKKGGTILFSGFYREDADDIVAAGNAFGLRFVLSREKNNWNMVKMIKST